MSQSTTTSQTIGAAGSAPDCAQACCGRSASPDAGVREPVPAEHLQWKVGGMDCASCAATIRTALEGLPGVSDIRVSITREMLSLSLDDPRTTVETITRKVTALGYRAHRLGADTAGEAVSAAAPRWWESAKARVAMLGGVLVAAAFAVDSLAPALGNWVFLAATLLVAAPIARRAITAACLGAPFTIEMLMTIAAGGAIIIGEVAEAAVVVFLFSVGEVLEGFAAGKARAGIKALGSLVPNTAMVEESGRVREVRAASLRIGQVVVARSGDRIPADGEVVGGLSHVDESPITGESVPVAKEPGARVYAGSINHEATLRIRVDRAPEDNTIARIVTLVEEAQDAKAPTERFIESFARYYTPLIIGIAALVMVTPPLLGMGDWSTWTYRGLALLIIGCPCALVISVPAAVASSLSAAARHGMLVKGGAVIEALARAEVIAFDKTGTLTRGEPVVTEVFARDGDTEALLRTASAIEIESSHPLARAICDHAENSGIHRPTADAVRVVPGRGVEGELDGRRIFIGAPRFALEAGSMDQAMAGRVAELENRGKTVVVVVADGLAIGIIALRDEPRTDAAAGIRNLRQAGLEPVMLTGDNARTAAAIAGELGIRARAEMLPDTKVEAIRELAAARNVVMVGDGINDAPALASASVGVAMGSGTDVAMEAADAALMRNKVADVARLVDLSRATMANIRQNVTIALGLKAVFLVTTVTGTTGLWLAVFADTGATVLVTLNAMRLLMHLRSRKSEPTNLPPAPQPATA